MFWKKNRVFAYFLIFLQKGVNSQERYKRKPSAEGVLRLTRTIASQNKRF
jgi:hypothetical protein